jgi:hypothetical protein
MGLRPAGLDTKTNISASVRNWSHQKGNDKQFLLSGLAATNYIVQSCPQASDIHLIKKFSLMKTEGPATTKPITGPYLEAANLVNFMHNFHFHLHLFLQNSLPLRFSYQHFLVSSCMLHIPLISHSWLNNPKSIRWKVQHMKFLNV